MATQTTSSPYKCFKLKQTQVHEKSQDIKYINIRGKMQPKLNCTSILLKATCRIKTYFYAKCYTMQLQDQVFGKRERESESSVLLSDMLQFTVSTCHHVKLFSPLKPCSLHPIHRITRDAGVSIATAVQAVATRLWWGLVAVMCVCVRVHVWVFESICKRKARKDKKKKKKLGVCVRVYNLK